MILSSLDEDIGSSSRSSSQSKLQARQMLAKHENERRGRLLQTLPVIDQLPACISPLLFTLLTFCTHLPTHLPFYLLTYLPTYLPTHLPECDVPVPGIPGTGNFSLFFGGIGTGIGKNWYRKKSRNRYRKNLLPEKVSEPVSEKFGTGKSTGIGIGKIWYRN